MRRLLVMIISCSCLVLLVGCGSSAGKRTTKITSNAPVETTPGSNLLAAKSGKTSATTGTSKTGSPQAGAHKAGASKAGASKAGASKPGSASTPGQVPIVPAGSGASNNKTGAAGAAPTAGSAASPTHSEAQIAQKIAASDGSQETSAEKKQRSAGHDAPQPIDRENSCKPQSNPSTLSVSAVVQLSSACMSEVPAVQASSSNETASWSNGYAALNSKQFGVEEWISGNTVRYPSRASNSSQLCLTGATFPKTSLSLTLKEIYSTISSGFWFVHLPTSGSVQATASTVTVTNGSQSAVLNRQYLLQTITDGSTTIRFSYPSLVHQLPAPKVGCTKLSH